MLFCINPNINQDFFVANTNIKFKNLVTNTNIKFKNLVTNTNIKPNHKAQILFPFFEKFVFSKKSSIFASNNKIKK